VRDFSRAVFVLCETAVTQKQFYQTIFKHPFFPRRAAACCCRKHRKFAGFANGYIAAKKLPPLIKPPFRVPAGHKKAQFQRSAMRPNSKI